MNFVFTGGTQEAHPWSEGQSHDVAHDDGFHNEARANGLEQLVWSQKPRIDGELRVGIGVGDLSGYVDHPPLPAHDQEVLLTLDL